MRVISRTALSIGLLSLSLLMGSCGTFRGGEAASGPPTVTTHGQEALSGNTDEEVLARIVRRHVELVQSSGDANRGKLIQRQPYYFKEYEVYPDGPDAFEITIRETESRTAPRVAEVVLNKQRFATRLHRKKSDAQEDAKFLRASGRETLTFEFRNGKWIRAGSLFVANRVEENVNGEWTLLQEETEPTVGSQEPSGSWLSRVWSNLTGRY